MKVLFILENFYPKIGGVETLFWKLAKTLSKRGFKVTVFTSGAGKDVPLKESIHGFEIVRTRYSNRYLFTFFTIIKAYRLARQHDIVHTTSYNAALPAFISAFIARKKSIITFHEAWNKMWFSMTGFSYFSQLLHYYFEKLILLFPFTRFIAVSAYTAEALSYAGITNNKIVKIYNGLDYGFLSSQIDTSISKDDHYLFYGRLGISKGIPILLEAFTLLKLASNPKKLKMIVSFNDSSFDQLQNDLADRDINDIVEVVDQMEYEDLLIEIQRAKAILVPSFTEGFCFVATESIAMNAAIIHSGRGALKEVVGGINIKMNEFSGKGLAEAILLGENGQWNDDPKIEFDLKKSIDQYIDLYNELIKV